MFSEYANTNYDSTQTPPSGSTNNGQYIRNLLCMLFIIQTSPKYQEEKASILQQCQLIIIMLVLVQGLPTYSEGWLGCQKPNLIRRRTRRKKMTNHTYTTAAFKIQDKVPFQILCHKDIRAYIAIFRVRDQPNVLIIV